MNLDEPPVDVAPVAKRSSAKPVCEHKFGADGQQSVPGWVIYRCRLCGEEQSRPGGPLLKWPAPEPVFAKPEGTSLFESHIDEQSTRMVAELAERSGISEEQARRILAVLAEMRPAFSPDPVRVGAGALGRRGMRGTT